MKRIYVPNVPEHNFDLSGDEHNHLANVARARIGESIIAICGDLYDYHFQITSITKNKTTLEFVRKTPNSQNPHKHTVVFLGVIKPDNMTLVTQKLNELGILTLIPFTSSRTNAPAPNIEKLNRVSQQSCKQCGRSSPMLIQKTLTFPELLNLIKSESVAKPDVTTQIIFADECETAQKLGELKITKANSTALIIGPEGGFAEAEREQLRQIATPVSLGKRILRAETAAISAASIILSKLGEI
jgi:16S rRNA (uracil1498-N3)-methyltransferase